MAALIKPGGEASPRMEQQMALDVTRARDEGLRAEGQMAEPRRRTMAADADGEAMLGEERMGMSAEMMPREAAVRPAQEPEPAMRPKVLMSRPRPAQGMPMAQKGAPVAKPAMAQPMRMQQEAPPTAPRTEIEGGAIPTTQDEWQSRAQWEEFNRRQETRKGLRDISQMRTQAELDRHRAQVFRQREEIAGGMKEAALGEATLHTRSATHAATMADEASRTAGVEAQLTLDTAALNAADQERSAQAAAINVETLEAEIAARRLETGQISELTAAQVAQRQAQLDSVMEETAIAMEEATFAMERAEAEAAVMGAARGAGGQVVAAQEQEARAAGARQLGRIGRKADIAARKAAAGVKEAITKGDIAVQRARLDVTRTVGRAEQQRLAQAGHEERQQLIMEQARTRAEEIRTEGKHRERALDLSADEMTLAATRSTLQAATIEADAAGLGLDAQAAEKNAENLEQQADEGLDALISRPPIPDWNAIGRNAKKAQRWSNASSIVGIAGTVLSWF